MYQQKKLIRKIGQSYVDLSPVYDTVPKYGVVTWIGHFNLKIGKEINNQAVVGKYKLHDVTTGNRQKLKQFAQMHDMFLLSTKHEHE
jgi:hypothetical protein